MYQAHLIISGNVQGVGFRQYVKWAARKIGVSGVVWNRKDLKVEAILQGKKGKVSTVIKLIKKGPPISKVQAVDVAWEKASEQFDGFNVVK